MKCVGCNESIHGSFNGMCYPCWSRATDVKYVEKLARKLLLKGYSPDAAMQLAESFLLKIRNYAKLKREEAENAKTTKK